ncbi:hypothetical protein BHE74_00023683 [Ensete ventricosum]|nr:hypothetical protein GW17_00031063 [Ensete ventricosum]RWW68768.1 hypothetical protein BHE74_00023683 [Ensete ventricosum]RZR76608.1 hypothetical protein BHM03_00001450 [Ensete ventricosum]
MNNSDRRVDHELNVERVRRTKDNGEGDRGERKGSASPGRWKPRGPFTLSSHRPPRLWLGIALELGFGKGRSEKRNARKRDRERGGGVGGGREPPLARRSRRQRSSSFTHSKAFCRAPLSLVPFLSRLASGG